MLAVSYQFILGTPVPDLTRWALQKLQGRYPILSWDPAAGAEVALPDDVRLTVRTTSELVEVKIETRYPFQLKRGIQNFSAREFVDWLLSEWLDTER